MKIAILTLPLHTNYGGILQAYALQTVLERMGHQVEVLSCPQKKKLPRNWPVAFLKRFIKKFIFGRKVRVFLEHYHNKYYPLLSQNTQSFIDSYIHQRLIESFADIKPKDYDAIVVGSDQVWRPCNFRPMWKSTMVDAFLQFTKGWNLKRFAYAASFGSDVWEFDEQETIICKELVKDFAYISVREDSGINLCNEYLNAGAELVPDPTMLLTKDDYVQLIEKRNTPKSIGNLLCYILDEIPEKQKLIDKVAKERGLVPFRVNSKIENQFAPIDERIQPPVEQWLRGFYDAEFVVTDSFHACVFSIIFRKPFVVYGNAARGLARFKSLLSVFGLESNLITSLSEYSSCRRGLVAELCGVTSFQKKGLEFLFKGLTE